MSTPDSFINNVDSALKACRRVTRQSDWALLINSPIIQSPFVQRQLWQEELGSDLRQAQIAYAVLRWAVEHLRPDGVERWHSGAWRAYLLLRSVYFENMTFETVAEKSGVSESALYATRKKAVVLLADTLWHNNQSTADASGCHHYVLQQRLANLTADAQLLLNCLAVFPQLPSVNEIDTLNQTWRVPDSQTLLESLREQHFLLLDADEWRLREEIGRLVLAQLSVQDRRRLFTISAEFHQQQQAPLLAAEAWFRAGQPERAVALLLKEQTSLIESGQGVALGEQLTLLMREIGSAELHANIQLTLGDIALRSLHVSVAVDAYEAAIGSPEPAIRALAYYRHATATRQNQIEVALQSYHQAANILETTAPNPSLLLTIYLEQAHIFLQEQIDLERAEQNLQLASALLTNPEQDRASFARLQNLLGIMAGFKDEDHLAITHYLQAYFAAVEEQDQPLMMRVAHNLGVAYTWSERYDEGQLYLKKAMQLAERGDDQKIRGGCLKTLGVNFLKQARYSEAIDHYKQAFAIFDRLGSQNWMAAIACDLTEAYAAAGDADSLQHYWALSERLIKQTGANGLRSELDALPMQYPHLFPQQLELNERQLIGYAYAKEHGAIDKRTYAEVANTSLKTAYRDLQGLVDRGLLIRKGQGRSTVYV